MTPHDLLTAFETLADAPDGIERLRELVLELAVRGKLVPQDPEDTPASVLLERLATARHDTPSRRKGKKHKRLPVLRKEDLPYDLPESWEWARFATVAEIASNLVKPSLHPNEPHVAPNHIEKATGRLLKYRTVAEDGVRSSKHLFQAGQILYSKIRPNLSKAVTVDFAGLCSADMYPIVARIDRGYLHRFILSGPFIAQVVADDNRLAMPKVNRQQLSAVAVAVPPLAEQRRIVARIGELMGLLDRLEAARTKRDETRVALRDAALAALRNADDAEAVDVAWARVAEQMSDLFTEPDDVEPLRQTILQLAVRGRLVPQDPDDEPASALLERIAAEKARLVKEKKIRRPKRVPPVDENGVSFVTPSGWSWCRIADITFSLPYGSASKSAASGEVPVLRMGNLQRSEVDWTSLKYTSDSKEIQKYSLPPMSVLFNRTNSPALVGKTSIYRGGRPAIYAGYLIRLDLAPGADPEYVNYCLNSPLVRDWCQVIKSDGVSQSNISASKLAALAVPIPPLPEQRRIVCKVRALLNACAEFEARLDAATASHSAFADAVIQTLAQ